MCDSKILRANLIGGMNSYVLDVIGDEEITDYWLAYGVPDGTTEDELMEFDEDDFNNLVRVFYTCIEMRAEA